MPSRREIQRIALLAVGVGGAVPIMFIPQMIFGSPGPVGSSSFAVTTTVCIALALAWAAWFNIASFRRSDEFIQERSKFAWYWGSLIGLATVIPIFAFVSLGGLHGLSPRFDVSRSLRQAFGYGMMLPIMAQVIGFAA